VPILVGVRGLIARLAVGAFGLFVLAGCAAFPGRQLPVVAYDQLASDEPRPSIDYDVKFFTALQPDPSGVYFFNREIVNVFGRSRAFSTFAVGTGTARYHLTLMLRDETDLALGALGGFLSAVTAGLIPARVTDTLTLQIDVRDGRRVIRHYAYKDAGRTWIGLFLIVLAPTHWPPAVARGIVDNMLLNFLHDLQRDRILAAPSIDTGGAGGSG